MIINNMYVWTYGKNKGGEIKKEDICDGSGGGKEREGGEIKLKMEEWSEKIF